MDEDGPINPCCLQREIAGRFHRQRAAQLAWAMRSIVRTKSHAAAVDLARTALTADFALDCAVSWDARAGPLESGRDR